MLKINRQKKRVISELSRQQKVSAIAFLQKRRTTPTNNIKQFAEETGLTTENAYKMVNQLQNADGFNVNESENNYQKVIDLYKKYRGRNMKFIYEDEGRIIIDRTIQIPNNVEEWFDEGEKWYWRRKTEEGLFEFNNYNGRVYALPANSLITKERIVQSYRDGIEHCVLSPILKWSSEMLENTKSSRSKTRYSGMCKNIKKMLIEYNSGIPDDKMNEVCEKLKIKIDIINVLDNQPYLSYGNNQKDILRTFEYTNVRINHLDSDVFKQKIINNTPTQTVSEHELFELLDELYNNKETFLFSKTVSHKVNKIICEKGIFSTHNRLFEIKKNIEKEYGFDGIQIDHLNNRRISDFVISGTHYNCSMLFPRFRNYNFNSSIKEGWMKCIDQKKAYFNFRSNDYYEGFLGKITDFRKTDKIQGVGLYLIGDLKFSLKHKFTKLNAYMNIYKKNNVYTSAELNYLKDNGCTFTIIGGCWGVKPFEFDFGLEALEKVNKEPFYDGEDVKIKGSSIYSLITGMWDSKNEYNSYYMYGTEETAQMIKNQSGRDIDYFEGEIQIKIPRKTIKHCGHITAFILAYQRIGLLQQLMQMDINKLVGVYVDGIYFEDHDFRLLSSFEEKDTETFYSLSFKEYSFITRLGVKEFDFGEPKDNYPIELWTGAGGCGKTHIQLTDKGYNGIIYSAMTHKLNTTKSKEYGVSSLTWAKLLGYIDNFTQSILNKNAVIALDEISMMTESIKQTIISKFPTHKLIFCGDVGYQLPPVQEGEEFKIHDFKFHKHLTESKRSLCNRLLTILQDCRNCIEKGWYCDSFNIKRVDLKFVQDNYVVEDMILCHQNKNIIKYNKMFGHLKKWYIEDKSTALFKHGEIIISDEQPEGGQIKHAYTVHSIQGETAVGKLFLDGDIFNSANMRLIYTALSRAKTIDQIYIVNYQQ